MKHKSLANSLCHFAGCNYVTESGPTKSVDDARLTFRRSRFLCSFRRRTYRERICTVNRVYLMCKLTRHYSYITVKLMISAVPRHLIFHQLQSAVSRVYLADVRLAYDWALSKSVWYRVLRTWYWTDLELDHVPCTLQSTTGCDLKMTQHQKCDYSVTLENFCAKYCTLVR